MPILEVQHICKTFDNTQVLKDISFTLEKGEALSMIGTSGSGKTTLLRCLNFLETPTSGKILVNDKPVFDSETANRMSEAQIRENRLHFGMVFQSFNLFPQYTALQNVTLAKTLIEQKKPEFKANKKRILDEIKTQGEALLDSGKEQRPDLAGNTIGAFHEGLSGPDNLLQSDDARKGCILDQGNDLVGHRWNDALDHL